MEFVLFLIDLGMMLGLILNGCLMNSCSRSDLAKPSNLLVFPTKMHGFTMQKNIINHVVHYLFRYKF